jgi:hypothetical protein
MRSLGRTWLGPVLAAALTAAVISAPTYAAAATDRAQANACGLLSDAEIAQALGSPVPAGAEFAGPEVCRWSNDEPPITTVLLIVRPAGSLREQVLCGDLRQGVGEGEPVEGVAEVALWHFENVISLFNSGELQTCGAQGYISVTVSMERDEATLKQAALTLFTSVQSQL